MAKFLIPSIIWIFYRIPSVLFRFIATILLFLHGHLYTGVFRLLSHYLNYLNTGRNFKGMRVIQIDILSAITRDLTTVIWKGHVAVTCM